MNIDFNYTCFMTYVTVYCILNCNFVKMTPKIEITNCQDCRSFNSSVFCNLNNNLLADLNRDKSVLIFKKGQYIFSEGARPQGICCIRKGSVKIHKFGLNKDQIVRIGYKSDIIGYRALIANEFYSATAEALEDTEVCIISKSSFLKFINSDKEFPLKIMRILSTDVKNAENNTMNIAQSTVMERLATYLFLKHKRASESDTQEVFSYSRKDLSDIIGCAPETISRAIADLRETGIISIYKKDIKVQDIYRLRRIVNNF